jgi:hypothetical protein
LVATNVNEPAALAAIERLSVAEVPDESAATEVIEMVGGTVAGWKANVALFRATPVTVKLEIWVVAGLVTTNFGLIDKIAGEGIKMK